MRNPWMAALLLAALLPRPAAASSVAMEGTASRSNTEETQQSTRAGAFGDALTFDLDLPKHMALNGRVAYTRQRASPPQDGAVFRDSGGNVFQGTLGLDLTLARHLIISVGGSGSPASTTYSNSTVDYVDAKGREATADAQLLTRASSWGGQLSLTWDSVGELDEADLDADLPEPGAVEGQVSLLAGATNFHSFQRINQLATATGTVKVDPSTTKCEAFALPARRKACERLAKTLAGQTDNVVQLPLTLLGALTLWEDTDLALSATYYLYSEDPTQVGYFTSATAGRETVSFGAGVPIAPLRFSVRPEVSHIFADRVAPSLYYERGIYVDDLGHSDAVGLRLKVRINRQWKLWASATAERDVDEEGNVLPAGSASLGVRYTF